MGKINRKKDPRQIKKSHIFTPLNLTLFELIKTIKKFALPLPHTIDIDQFKKQLNKTRIHSLAMRGSISLVLVVTSAADTCPTWTSRDMTSSKSGGKALQNETRHGSVGMKNAKRLARVSTVKDTKNSLKWIYYRITCNFGCFENRCTR